MIDISLYQYLSEKIGSEDAVLTRRLLYSIKDYVCSTKQLLRMTSGSKGEGLDMKGSDLDIMVILNNINIYEFKSDDTPPDSFIMSTKTTKPGFTHLQACDKRSPMLGWWCVNFEDKVCLSSHSLKLFLKLLHNSTTPPSHIVIHGPCLSPDTMEEDLCISFRCRSWISLANQWVTRHRLWPPSELVSEITDFGVLFVPIGCKGSPNEFLEWRISFSAAEKLLIHSFSHTQLLCYALLKLLLKEVIEQKENLKGLLCSYFLKTVVFWVSESLPASEWRPDNIVSCFMQVFKRLLYYVEYNHLPHYFITDMDLFENRFSLQQQAELKAELSRLYQMDIKCMEQSQTLSRFFHPPVEQSSHDSMTTDEKNLTEKINILIRSQSEEGFMAMFLIANTAPEKIFNLQSHNTLKSNSFLYLITMYNVLQVLGSKHILRLSRGNKDHYKDGHKKYFPYLLCGRKTDAVTGWLTIASYFYNMKRYQIVIDIIDHVLKKCTPDKLYHRTGSYNFYQFSNIKDDALHYSHSNVIDVFLRNVVRYQDSSYLSSILIPELNQVQFYSSLPPKVYACFLQFLCFHRLPDFQKRREALIDLQTAVKSKYSGLWSMATSYICLGISHGMIGDRGKAKSCFNTAKEFGHHQSQYFKYIIDHLPQ